MDDQLLLLRRQRDRGRRRVIAATVASAGGATTLAAAFGMVLAGSSGQSAAPSAPTGVSTATVRNVDVVAPSGTLPGSGPDVTAHAHSASVPAGAHAATARPASVREELRAPAEPPRAAPKESGHAASGAS